MDEAVETARRAVRLDPDSFVAHWILGGSLGTAGQFDESVATLGNAAEMSNLHTLAVTCLAGVFGQWDNRSDAAALHRELIDRASRGCISAAHLAITAEAAGLREEPVASARLAWKKREPPFILWARHFPQFRSLDADPRVASILREMESA